MSVNYRVRIDLEGGSGIERTTAPVGREIGRFSRDDAEVLSTFREAKALVRQALQSEIAELRFQMAVLAELRASDLPDPNEPRNEEL